MDKHENMFISKNKIEDDYKGADQFDKTELKIIREQLS